MNLTCVQPYARGNGTLPGQCDCNGGYSGPECRTLLAWWVPVQWLCYAAFLAVMAFYTLWAWAKLVHTWALRGRRAVNLSFASMVLNALGNALRLGLRAIVQTPAFTLAYDQPLPLATRIAFIVLNGASAACWIASLALVTGFWVQVLHAKLHARMATRTQVACVVGAATTLLMIPGMLLATVFGQFLLGTVIILLPYVIATVLFNVLVVVLRARCCQAPETAKRSAMNLARIRHVNTYMTIAALAWIPLTLAGALSGIVKGAPHADALSFLFVVLSSVAECVAVWATMMLLERDLGPWRVLRELAAWTHTRDRGSDRGSASAATGTGTDTDTTLSAGALSPRVLGAPVAPVVVGRAADGANSEATTTTTTTLAASAADSE